MKKNSTNSSCEWNQRCKMEQNQLYTQFYTSQNLNAQFLSPFIGKITHSKNLLQAYRNSDFCVFEMYLNAIASVELHMSLIH